MTFTPQLPQPGRLFPVCCAAEIPPSVVDRYLMSIFEYKDMEAVYSVIIDDLAEKYTKECDVNSPRTAATKAPFKGKDLYECSSLLQQMCRDGSDIDYSSFVIMDERTLHDDTVLFAVSDWQDGQETIRSIRSAFEVVEERLGGYGVVPEEFERDLATAAEAEDGVLRAHAIEARTSALGRYE
ncbi:uncharacterized protein RCC_05783 [Ramularia collo-cygni]|uniref:Uncharacterized protein n=1 Tax=Ramularia collo-cygni TaxID=112498 RepID=A0A2D3V5E3_9PEZI|nr:uncharacterized protein RCC_05783 [Ramularia collo-cygni]CZT19927.1 uncharacterized protein RCC_05783 [Ramularia collo-cygni]